MDQESRQTAASSAERAKEEPQNKPEKGDLRGWRTVIGSSLVFFASYGFSNSFGYFQDFYQTDYLEKYSPATIAFIGTLQNTLLCLVGPVGGALFDYYGLKWTYPIGAMGACGSLLGLSFSQRGAIWQQFLSQGVLFGLTMAFGVQPALAVVAQHFERQRGLAMGFVAAGSSVGGVCLPIMFSHLVPKIGFNWSMRVAALMLLFCYLAAISMSQTKKTTKNTTSTRMSLGKLLDFAGYKDPRYLALAIGCFMTSLGLYVPYYYIEGYMTLRFPSTSIQRYLLPCINGTSFFGRIIGGFLADRVGRLNILGPMTLLAGLLCLVMWLPAGHVATIVAFVCLYGPASGVFVSVTPAAVAQISPIESVGARTGAFFTLTAIAALIGTPIAGWILKSDAHDGFGNLIIFAGVTMVVGGACFLFARILCSRNLREKW